jgi:hypothetical protein
MPSVPIRSASLGSRSDLVSRCVAVAVAEINGVKARQPMHVPHANRHGDRQSGPRQLSPDREGRAVEVHKLPDRRSRSRLLVLRLGSSTKWWRRTHQVTGHAMALHTSTIENGFVYFPIKILGSASMCTNSLASPRESMTIRPIQLPKPSTGSSRNPRIRLSLDRFCTGYLRPCCQRFFRHALLSSSTDAVE